nr:ATP-binding protein [Pseudenhygromyxa sp. WMMC2535]
MQRSLRPAFLGLAAASVGYGACLLAEWSQLTSALEWTEDLFGVTLPVWWLFVVFSVAQRAQLEQIEQQSREFSSVLDNSFQLVGKLSVDGRVLMVNARAREFIGSDGEAELGQPFWETRWWAHSKALQKRVRAAVKAAAEGEFVRFKTSHVDIRESVRAIDFSLRPLVDDAGQVRALIAEGRDITDSEAANAERERLREELLQSQKLEIVGRLASGVAHDFNNLLTVVMGNTDLLRSECPEDPEIQAALDAMDAAVEQGEGVARSLLSFARPTRPRRERVDLGECVEIVCRLLRRILPDSISLEVDVQEGVSLCIDGDDSQLQQLLMNLSINARDAMISGGRLRIELGRRLSPHNRREEVVLTVSDTGVGIPERLVERVFEPFFTTKGDAGTGLGLAVVRTIAESHGAALTLDSKPGRGTAFCVAFPLGVACEASAEMSLEDIKIGQGEHVLLVEDNPSVRALMAKGLRSHGFVVTELSDGVEALKLLLGRGKDVSVVVSDVDMPGMDGISCMERARDGGVDVPFVLISGRSVDFRGQVEEEVGVRLLGKPFRAVELAWVVYEVLMEKDTLVRSVL